VGLTDGYGEYQIYDRAATLSVGTITVNTGSQFIHDAGSVTARSALDVEGAYIQNGGLLRVMSLYTGAGLVRYGGTAELNGVDFQRGQDQNIGGSVIVQGDPKSVDAFGFFNGATFTVSTSMSLTNGSFISNSGTFNTSSDLTLSRSGLSNSRTFSASGNLTFSGSSSLYNTGALSAGGAASFAGGSWLYNSGTAGTLTFSGSGLTFTGASSATNLATISASGGLSFAGGGLANSGTIAAGGGMTFSGSSALYNSGTLSAVGAGVFSERSTFSNLAPASLGGATFSGGSSLTNSATLTLSGGASFSGTSFLSNPGTVIAQSLSFSERSQLLTWGNLSVSGGVGFSGTSVLSNSGTMSVGGMLSFSGGSTLFHGTAGAMVASGGLGFSGASTFYQSGALTVGGAMSFDGASVFNNAAPLTVSTALTLSNQSVLNNGALYSTSADITMSGGSTINLSSVLELRGGASITGGASGGTVNASGTLRSLAGGNVTVTFSAVNYTSTVDVQAGTLVMSGPVNGGVFSGGNGVTKIGPGILTVSGSQSSGGYRVNAGTLNINADLNNGGLYVAGGSANINAAQHVNGISVDVGSAYQNGVSVISGGLLVGGLSSGSALYEVVGGDLTTDYDDVGDHVASGAYVQNAGHHVVVGGVGIGLHGSYTVSGGDVVIGTPLGGLSGTFVVGTPGGLAVNDGGVLNISGTLVSDGGGISIGGTEGSCTVNDSGVIVGYYGGMTQQNGVHNVAGGVTIDRGNGTPYSPYYRLEGGTLNASSVDNGNTFIVSGPTTVANVASVANHLYMWVQGTVTGPVANEILLVLADYGSVGGISGTGVVETVWTGMVPSNSASVVTGPFSPGGPGGGTVSVSLGANELLNLSGGLTTPYSNTTLAVSGAGGVMNVNGLQRHSSGALLAVASGTVNLNTDAGGTSVGTAGNLSVSVASGAALGVVTPQRLNSLSVNGSASVISGGTNRLHVASVSIGGGGVMDLADSPMEVHYGSVSSPAGSIRQWLVSGYNAGYWNGTGLVSRNAAAVADPDNNPTLAVGYGDGAVGVVPNLDAHTVIVRQTYYGDANLDGSVNDTDINLLTNSGKYNTNQDAAWTDGDFDYSGRADFWDLVMLLNNYGITISPFASVLGGGKGGNGNGAGHGNKSGWGGRASVMTLTGATAADSLRVDVDTHSGHVTLSGSGIELVGYDLHSAAGRLLAGHWRELAGAHGSGFTAIADRTDDLTEIDPSGGYWLDGTLDLGNLWAGGPTQDLTFQYANDTGSGVLDALVYYDGVLGSTTATRPAAIAMEATSAGPTLPVPEPAGAGLAAIAAVGLLRRRRRAT
jgi:autotransporter-associated beta strand protein